MAKPITEKFEQMVLETSENGTAWTRICGLIGVTITRSAQVDTSEVPGDCNDESLPLDVEKAVRSIDVSVSADGSWAQQSHGDMLDWFYSGAPKQIRVGHLNAAPGDTEYEVGPALLTTLTNQRTKGQKVTCAIELQFDGVPARLVKAGP
ncbi:phage major tail protein [Paracoccus aminophilus JCM 7686]|uniref:Phage major tail protein n=2 Tax=Paracoccus aminophilus TaxID=34003 RepID=S5XVL7_PARAH|nr:phage major tail protein [Paracoccus aminophilus JCM 7686]AGT10561.1 phage major tail protein [Paracoccus aminophilus JCM 7686]